MHSSKGAVFLLPPCQVSHEKFPSVLAWLSCIALTYVYIEIPLLIHQFER